MLSYFTALVIIQNNYSNKNKFVKYTIINKYYRILEIAAVDLKYIKWFCYDFVRHKVKNNNCE